MILASSGRCGSTLLQSILNTNPDFLIWGEHNGFLRHVAEAYYQAWHQHFPVEDPRGIDERMQQLRDPDRWIAWDNLCDADGFRDRFRTFVRSFFADPTGRRSRWGFKEIRYPADASDQALNLIADCFPEARFLVLIRDPEATIFSMISHWALVKTAAPMNSEELDERILAAAARWNERYLLLNSFSEARPSQCTQVRYEELDCPETYQRLAAFLQTSSFDSKAHLERVHGASNKMGVAVAALRERMESLRPRIAGITRPACIQYGYAGSAAAVR